MYLWSTWVWRVKDYKTYRQGSGKRGSLFLNQSASTCVTAQCLPHNYPVSLVCECIPLTFYWAVKYRLLFCLLNEGPFSLHYEWLDNYISRMQFEILNISIWLIYGLHADILSLFLIVEGSKKRFDVWDCTLNSWHLAKWWLRLNLSSRPVSLSEDHPDWSLVSLSNSPFMCL